MPSTFSIADARGDFSRIIDWVSSGGNTVTLERYGKPVAKIVPAKAKAKPKKDWDALAKKYAGMWSGPGYEWVDKIGRPSRYFRKRDYWK